MNKLLKNHGCKPYLSLTAYAFSLAICASAALATDNIAINRNSLDREMGSTDTCIIDDGQSVRRSGSASLRDCFDRTKDTALRGTGHAIGDAYKHGKYLKTFECVRSESENVICTFAKGP